MVTNASANHHGIREYLAAAAVRDAILAAAAAAGGGAARGRAGSTRSGSTASTAGCWRACGPSSVYDSRERYFADSAESFVENRFEAGRCGATRRACCAGTGP